MVHTVGATSSWVAISLAALGSSTGGGSAADAAAKGVAPTFGNLGDQAAGHVVGTLTEVDGVYEIGGEIAEGRYDFVVRNGEILVGKGHPALAGGSRVSYAGEITIRAGQIAEWTNASGHFRPAAAFAPNAGLPMESFRPAQFPAMVGGPQLPVVQ